MLDDLRNMAVCLIAAGIAWYVKGPNAGLIMAGAGAALAILLHFFKKKKEPSSALMKDSGNATASATGGAGGTATATGNSLTQHLHFPTGVVSAPHSAPPPPKREPLPLKVEFEPSMHQSEKLYLAVKNVAVKQMFRAQCRVVERRNDPNPQPRMIFNLTWEHGGRDKYLQRGESGNLLIASAGADRFSDMEWMKLEGTNAPDSHWPRSEKQRPEYDLEITVFGLDSDETQMESFTLKAGAARALEMRTRKIVNM